MRNLLIILSLVAAGVLGQPSFAAQQSSLKTRMGWSMAAATDYGSLSRNMIVQRNMARRHNYEYLRQKRLLDEQIRRERLRTMPKAYIVIRSGRTYRVRLEP